MQHELIGSAENSDSMLPGKSAEAPRKRNPLSSTTRWLHLVGLSALAIAQPILGRLGGNSPYLKIENFDPATLWVMLVIILAGLPALIFIATIAVGQIHRKTSDVVYHGFVFVLATLLSLSFANWLSKLLRLKSFGIPDTALLVCALFAACLFVILYRRYPSISQCLTLASISPLLVAVSFLTSPQMKPFLFSKPVFSRVATVDCANPVPVVMIVFDGLNGMALLNEEFQLDAIRYPNFARLARQSTWYRNATTVHYRTSNAVPAILTGRLPGENTVPTEESFPDNLFRQIYDSGQYDMTVFEPLTRLCPEEISPVPPRSDLVSQQLSLLRTLGLVYLDISLPDEFSNVETISPLPWFGLREKPLFGDSSVLGLAIYGWDSQRKEQFEHFLKCILPSDKPTFRFLHVVLPHYPWCYLPSGRGYGTSRATNIPIGAHGELGEDWGPDQLATDQAWQQYLLQLGFVDHYLGAILDKLETEQLLDESLMIVVGDHGTAFKPGISRRVPTGDTLEDLMPVPLFIKLPHQNAGIMTDRNVETIDVFPTIADVLQMTPEVAVDGCSLLDDRQPERLRKLLIGVNGPVIVEPDFPERFNYAKRATERFGSGHSDKLFSAVNALPNLTGQNIDNMSVSEQPGVSLELYTGETGYVKHTDSFVPCYLNGSALTKLPNLPTYFAVSVNGRIQCTTRTLNDPPFERCWAAMLPESAFQPGMNNIEIYEVRTSDNGVTLRKCPVLRI